MSRLCACESSAAQSPARPTWHGGKPALGYPTVETRKSSTVTPAAARPDKLRRRVHGLSGDKQPDPDHRKGLSGVRGHDSGARMLSFPALRLWRKLSYGHTVNGASQAMNHPASASRC